MRTSPAQEALAAMHDRVADQNPTYNANTTCRNQKATNKSQTSDSPSAHHDLDSSMI